MSINKSVKRFVGNVLITVFMAASAFSQTGGTFEIEKSVIASGGNASSGGTFTLESTSGQTVSNASPSGGTFSILSGFWTPIFTATAASVTVTGKVSQLNGRGIAQAIVFYSDVSGNVKTTRTGSFGYFRFENVEVGQTCIFQVSAKGYLFAPQVVNVQENISDLNFISMTNMRN